MAARAGRALDVSSRARDVGRGRAPRARTGRWARSRRRSSPSAPGDTARALEALQGGARRRSDQRGGAPGPRLARAGRPRRRAERSGRRAGRRSPRSAVARLEAVDRAEKASCPSRRAPSLLERAHRAAPALPIAAFLAERIARRAGDVEEVLRWIRERRAHDGRSHRGGARRRPRGAPRGRPRSGARDRAAARGPPRAPRRRRAPRALRARGARAHPTTARLAGARAAEATATRARCLFLEAAQRIRARAATTRARCAARRRPPRATRRSGAIARERAELGAGQVARLADELLTVGEERRRTPAPARGLRAPGRPRRDGAPGPRERAALAPIDPRGAAGLPAEPAPRRAASHRRGPRRGARADRERDRGGAARHRSRRGTAHAELAARLRMRGAAGQLGGDARDGRARGSPRASRRSGRCACSQAHAPGARATTTPSSRRRCASLERTSRPLGGRGAARRARARPRRASGELDEARSLLERAATEDPGDVVAWGLLADVRQRAGDPRGAAEACEALARSSVGPRAPARSPGTTPGASGRTSAHDEDRAIVALEAAAAIDVALRGDLRPPLAPLRAAQDAAGAREPARAAHRGRSPTRRSGSPWRCAAGGSCSRWATPTARARAFEVGARRAARRRGRALGVRRPLRRAAGLGRRRAGAGAPRAPPARRPRSSATSTRASGELYSRHLREPVARRGGSQGGPQARARRRRDDGEARRRLPAAERPGARRRAAAGARRKAQTPEDKRARLVELAAHPRADGARQPQGRADARGRAARVPAGRRRAARARRVLHAPPADARGQHPARPRGRRRAARPRGGPLLAAPLRGPRRRSSSCAARRTRRASRRRCSRRSRGARRSSRGARRSAPSTRASTTCSRPRCSRPALRALLAKTGDALDAASALDLRALKARPAAGRRARSRASRPPASPPAIGLRASRSSRRRSSGRRACRSGRRRRRSSWARRSWATSAWRAFLVLRALKLIQASRLGARRARPRRSSACSSSAWLKCFNPRWQPQGINAAALNAAGGQRPGGAAAQPATRTSASLALEVAGHPRHAGGDPRPERHRLGQPRGAPRARAIRTSPSTPSPAPAVMARRRAARPEGARRLDRPHAGGARPHRLRRHRRLRRGPRAAGLDR